jgi:hypothetical protein
MQSDFWRPAAALLATTLLAGCSGSGAYPYLRNTFTLPFGANPNVAPGSGEVYSQVRGKQIAEPAPILTEPGDIWPAPAKAPPTLKDLQAQQSRELTAGANGGANLTPLEKLPDLPGFEVPEQIPSSQAPQATFPTGIVPLPHGKGGTATSGGGALPPLGAPGGNGTIVVPNGNGTSTVISPNGAVSTIPTPGK